MHSQLDRFIVLFAALFGSLAVSFLVFVSLTLSLTRPTQVSPRQQAYSLIEQAETLETTDVVLEPSDDIYLAETNQIVFAQIASPEQAPAIMAIPKPSASPQPTNQPTSAPTPTPIPTQPPTEVVPEPVVIINEIPASPYETIFQQWSDHFGVDINVLKHIARCESGYNPTSNNSNIYGGMFQFSAPTWRSTRQAMQHDDDPELRFDPEEAIKTAAFKIAQGGQNAWKNCLP